MAISLVASYFAASSIFGDTGTLSTPSFTPADGEVIVVKANTWDNGTAIGPPSGGGLTYTRQITAAPSGFYPYATIFTAVVSGSPGAMTVSIAPASSSSHTMCVERWSGAQLTATPVTNTIVNGDGIPMSTTLTTRTANSIITWTAIDQSNQDPTGRVYLSSAVDEGISDGHTNFNDVMYHAYQPAGAAGPQTMGISSPTIIKWVLVGIEIQPGGAPPVAAGFMSFFS
jgi:hypothetical protein